MTTKKFTKQEALNQFDGFYYISDFSAFKITNLSTHLLKNNALVSHDAIQCIDYLTYVFHSEGDYINTRLVVNDVLNKLSFNRGKFFSLFIVYESIGDITNEQRADLSFLFLHNELYKAKRNAKKFIIQLLKKNIDEINMALNEYELKSKGFFKFAKKSEVSFVKAIIKEVIKEYQSFIQEISEDDIVVNQIPENKKIKVNVFPNEAKQAYLLKNTDFHLTITTLDIQLCRINYDALSLTAESQYDLVNEKGRFVSAYDTTHSTIENDCINWNKHNNRIFISKKALHKMIKKINKNIDILSAPD